MSHYEHQENNNSMKVRGIISKKKKKNNVVIIVSGEDAAEIQAELLLTIRQMARKKELGFYITPVEVASLKAVQEFAEFSLQISTTNRR